MNHAFARMYAFGVRALYKFAPSAYFLPFFCTRNHLQRILYTRALVVARQCPPCGLCMFSTTGEYTHLHRITRARTLGIKLSTKLTHRDKHVVCLPFFGRGLFQFFCKYCVSYKYFHSLPVMEQLRVITKSDEGRFLTQCFHASAVKYYIFRLHFLIC